ISVIVRDGTDARLLAFDDPLWGRPVYAGQTRRASVVTLDPNAVPGRFAQTSALSRFRGRGAPSETGERTSRAAPHEHLRGVETRATNPDVAKERYASDRHDYGRQTVRALRRQRFTPPG